jgi:VanZ family protein
MKLDRLWWSLGVMLVVAAVTVCLVPGPSLPVEVVWNDKFIHGLGHCLLAMYFAGLVAGRSWWKIFVFLLTLGISIEYAQHYMHAGREADPRDVLANSTGAALGLVFARMGVSRWPELAAWLLGQRAVQ